MTEFAVVGLGAWGLSLLERTVSRARRTGQSITVHVIQPGSIGGAAYDKSQPDYLVLNVSCGQLQLYAAQDDEVEPAYALGLEEWARRAGYRWVGHECRVTTDGREIEGGDYLPRRIMGEYLQWFYDALLASAPANLTIVRHVASAVDIVPIGRGREQVVLDDGTTLEVSHVVVTSGHTQNEERDASGGGVNYLRPYPVGFFSEQVPAGSPIAISGMGLVAFDLLMSLTLGRGGSFNEDGERLRYAATGREPAITLYSRSGVPYCAKSAYGGDPTGSYEPIACTPQFFADLTGAAGGVRRQVDFRGDLLPYLLAEMTCRYYVHSARVAGGPEAAAGVHATLKAAWGEGHLEKALADLEPQYGHFKATDQLFAGADEHFASSADYESWVYEQVETDLRHALTPGGSPVKAAQEVTRILRDQLRSVIEFGGLSLDSYVDFQANVRGRINRMEAGPPPLRSAQLLALMDAGVVRVPFGPAPTVEPAPGGRTVLRSTQLDRLHAGTVNHVVRGHLDMPSLARSASPLLRRLYTLGRLTQFSYGATPVGSVAISEDFHPFDAEGRVQQTISLLGVLTEGVRYFTHYLPSPRSRIRAVLDAQACVEAIVG